MVFDHSLHARNIQRQQQADQIAGGDGNVWYTIYHHLPIVKGVPSFTPLLINQWEFGTSMRRL